MCAQNSHILNIRKSSSATVVVCALLGSSVSSAVFEVLAVS